MQERLVNTISICQDLGQDASGEAFKPDAAKVHLPPRQLTEESVATSSSLETSSAPRNEHLLLQDSKPLSPVLLKSSSIEPQSSVSASWPPETLTTGRRHSPPQQWAPSYPSHPLDPVACPPPMPDTSMAAPESEWKVLATSQSTPLQGLSSPMPTTPGLNLSRRPTSAIPGLNYSNRPTSTTPGFDYLSRPTSTTSGHHHLNRPTTTTAGLNHISRPTSTTPGLVHLSRPTFTNPGLDHLSRPASTTQGLDHVSRHISDPFRYHVASTTSYHSNLTRDESLQGDLLLTIHEPSFRTGPTDCLIEAGEPSFINCDMLDMLEAQISKRVQLKFRKEKEKERSDLCLLHSWGSKQDNITSRLFWSKNCKSEQFLPHQKVLGNNLKETYNQLFWGHPILHSESLVANVRMEGARLHRPSILFNGSSAYSPLQDQTNDPPQLCSPQPLLHHSVKSQPMTPKFSRSKSPPETRLQTQACDPSPLSKLPCDSAPIKDDGAPCPTPPGTQVIVPSAVEHLERHFLKKPQESMRDLPVTVNESQEEFHQHTSNRWDSQGEFISVELWQQMEKDTKKTFKQQQRQCRHKAQLSLDLDQAQLNHRTSCPLALANESSQHPQSVSSNGPEKFHPRRNQHQDLTKRLQRALRKPLYRSLEVLETICETEEETSHNRHPRSVVPSVSMVGPGKEELEGTRRYDEWIQTKDTMLPTGTCCEISKPTMETWKKPSFHDSTNSKKTNNETFIVDLGIQKVLEGHVTRRLVRHKWRLLLRVLKTIRVLNMKATTTLPFPQPSNASLPWESRDNSTIQMAGALGEPCQKDPEKEWTKTSTMESQSTQKCPSVLQVEYVREAPAATNFGPFDAPTVIQRGNVTSFREFSIPSQSSNSRNIRELVETEEEEPYYWIIPLETVELGNIEINEFLETSGSLSSPFESFSQESEDSGRSTPHCSAAGIGLQECAIGEYCLDWVPEVLLAAESLVSRASQASFKVASTEIKSPFKDRYPVPKNSKPEEQQNSHISVTNKKKYTSRKPRQEDIKVKGTKSVQGHRSTNEKFVDKIRSFVQSILTPKYKEEETSRQKCKGLLPMTQSQPSVTGQLFMPVAEGQNFMTSVGQILKKKLGVHNSCVSPSPVSRPGSHNRIPMKESKKNQGNSTVHQANHNLHRKPAQDKGMTCGNIQAQVSSPYQCRAQVPQVPKMLVHCPRHCLYRNI
ncbi:putative spermatogenesis-associated protein 31C1 [Microtus oregoni]|uniref:putative spermatogenesis-associated protein 31C1 n=1 Tax=Microtus oregoni TaxID=111838 RepID=UPI001BB2C9D8|nr:putative spermatogenesis-associated protein 31C1 [Microtus oregoni]